MTITMSEFEQLVDSEEMQKVYLSNGELKRVQNEFQSAYAHAMGVRKKYEGKAGNLTPTEHEEFDRAIADAEAKGHMLRQAQKTAQLEAFASKAANALRMGASGIVSGNDSTDIQRFGQAHLKAYRRYLSGQIEMNNNEWQRTPEWKTWQGILQRNDLPDEVKAYQADNPAGFGFAVPPQELVQNFITLMKDNVYLRRLATTYTIPHAESLGVPAIDTDPSDSDWTNEISVGKEETTLATGKREFRPNPLAKYIRESKKLLRQVPAVESLILDRLAYKMAITEEKAFLLGSGANAPLGVFTASTAGISTARDTAAAGTGSTTAIASDDVINTFYSLKAQYRARATWIMHRNVVAKVRLFKDTTNNYIWTSGYGLLQGLGPGGGLEGAYPERLLGAPILESEYAPNTFTTGLYMATVGDFSKYWIADAQDMQIQVLYELFALTNQMGYILRKETDGMPVLEEAFQRLKLA